MEGSGPLLGGRLLPPGLLAEMLPTVTVPPGSIPLPLYDRYGLGLLETETPTGRLVGMVGGIPGFLSIVLSTHDGRRQLGVMINVLAARSSWSRPSSRWFESSACGSSPSEPGRPVSSSAWDGPASGPRGEIWPDGAGMLNSRLRHTDAGSARCTVEVVADELGPSLPRRL